MKTKEKCLQMSSDHPPKQIWTSEVIICRWPLVNLMRDGLESGRNSVYLHISWEGIFNVLVSYIVQSQKPKCHMNQIHIYSFNWNSVIFKLIDDNLQRRDEISSASFAIVLVHSFVAFSLRNRNEFFSICF